MKQALQNLLAEGKTKQVIAQLMQLTIHDTDLKAEVVQLSARYAEYERQKCMGLEDPSVLSIELNKINSALLSLIGQLKEDNMPSVGVMANHPDAHPPKQGFSWTKWTGLNDVKSWIAVLAGLAGIMTFYFKYCKNVPDNDGKPFSVAVYTHGSGGRQEILQLKDTKIVADFGGRREVAKVGDNGQNIFAEIPPSFYGKKVGVGLSGTEGYVLTFPDSIYLLNSEPIYVAVALGDNTRMIKGVVKTTSGNFLEGVEVTTVGESVLTNAKGYFELKIPTEKQQPTYPLTLTKKGFQTDSETYIPQSQTAEFRLKK